MVRKPLKKKLRGKRRSWVRESPPGEKRHWLGEGSNGRDSLLLEIDPVLYAVDDAVHRFVNACAHSYDGNEKRPRAVLMPIAETLGWQIDYISKNYNLYVLFDEEPDGLEEARDFFQIQALDLEEFNALDHWLDLFLATNYSWNSLQEFFIFMNANLSLLSPEGKAMAVLRARAPLTLSDDSEMEIVWHDGSSSPLGALMNLAWYQAAKPQVERSICLPSLDPRDPVRLSHFVKRNRRFFGKDVQPLLLQLLDSDQQVAELFELPSSGEYAWWTVLLVWNSAAEY